MRRSSRTRVKPKQFESGSEFKRTDIQLAMALSLGKVPGGTGRAAGRFQGSSSGDGRGIGKRGEVRRGKVRVLVSNALSALFNTYICFSSCVT